MSRIASIDLMPPKRSITKETRIEKTLVNNLINDKRSYNQHYNHENERSNDRIGFVKPSFQSGLQIILKTLVER